MSVVPGEHRTPSPALTFNLSSNNPFRNHASPQPSPALSTPRTNAPRPQSRNPFLSLAEQDTLHLQRPQSSYVNSHLPPSLEPQRSSAFIRMPTAQEEKQQAYLERAEQLFNELKLKEDAEKAAAAAGRPGIHRSGTTPSSRPPRGPAETEGRRPSASRPPPGRRPAPPREELDIFASPDRNAAPRRPRRNSESSVMDRRDVDDERRRRERRARERRERDAERSERKERSERERIERSKDPRVKKPKGLDIIDKLDVSGIYGPSMFHHDGPFDACNPHRNRGRDRNAPMQAFPEGSANNVMGGAGPVNSKMNLDQFHGRGSEGFSDFSAAAKIAAAEPPKQAVPGASGWYNPKANIEFIHGDESNGLGTSTFLEGAPASKRDLERRQSENEQTMTNGGGLKRSKSLAQRIRGISQPRRDYMAARNMPSPNGDEFRRPPPPPPVANGQVTPDGRTHSASGSRNERNPFFDDYDDAYEKKGNTVKIAEQPRPTAGRGRAPSSPGQRAYDLPATNGSNSPDGEQKSTGGGFLTRMKSLKGGPRRPRPADRRPS
ncbi:Pal1 cell morphology protein-domain-containing protein [Phyllosticta citrichinensis]|uniref:Pal1 cell morphology protein-domain-containing protein n=1 Tax=Phyllosticta citrichinensis TaxID=1130410 RepID=A0ABR1XEX4_9PEZI